MNEKAGRPCTVTVSAYVDLLLSGKQAWMLIIRCLQMHFYRAPPVFLQTGRPWTVSVFLLELLEHAGSTFWFSSFDNNLTSPVWPTQGVMISIPYWGVGIHPAASPFQKVILWRPSKAVSSEAALSWTDAIFIFFIFHKSLPINIRSWQWVAPLFSLPSLDKEHAPKQCI